MLPEIGKTSTLCLRSWKDTYLGVGNGAVVSANNPRVQTNETFQVYRKDQDHVTFKCSNDQYLGARENGEIYTVPHEDKCERFKFIIDGTKVAFKSHHGHFLFVHGDGSLTATATSFTDRVFRHVGI